MRGKALPSVIKRRVNSNLPLGKPPWFPAPKINIMAEITITVEDKNKVECIDNVKKIKTYYKKRKIRVCNRAYC